MHHQMNAEFPNFGILIFLSLPPSSSTSPTPSLCKIHNPTTNPVILLNSTTREIPSLQNFAHPSTTSTPAITATLYHKNFVHRQHNVRALFTPLVYPTLPISAVYISHGSCRGLSKERAAARDSSPLYLLLLIVSCTPGGSAPVS